MLAITSVQAAVWGDSTSVRLPACLPSTPVCAANSFLLVLLCRASCFFIHLGLPPTPSPIALCLSKAQTPVLSVHSSFRNSPTFPPPCISSHLNGMPRERQRLISRRGGARGRVVAQHFSEEASAYPATRSGRGRGRGRGRDVVCSHHVHPMARYRIPCMLANSSFIVSVTIERCEHSMAPAAVHQGATEDQRGASQTTTPNQGTGSMPTTISEANVCPSKKGEPSSSALYSSDSMDSSQFGSRVIEEQPSTSAED